MRSITTESVKLGTVGISYWNDIEFHDFMLDCLMGKRPYESRSYFYHFSNAQIIEKDIIYGEIFKAKLQSTHDQLVSKHEFKYSHKEYDELYSHVRFCIFPDHTIVMTERSKFTSDEFIKVFTELFKKNCPTIARFSIRYKRNDEDIFEIIQGFSKMVRVIIKNLRKSNPHPRPIFEPIEKFMDNENTDEYSAEFISDPTSKTGLIRDYTSHIMSAISLTDAGYGESVIVGIQPNGEYFKIDSKDKIIQARIPRVAEENPTDFINTVFELFKDFIRYDKRRK